jgi:hypothetical protein
MAYAGDSIPGDISAIVGSRQSYRLPHYQLEVLLSPTRVIHCAGNVDMITKGKPSIGGVFDAIVQHAMASTLTRHDRQFQSQRHQSPHRRHQSNDALFQMVVRRRLHDRGRDSCCMDCFQLAVTALAQHDRAMCSSEASSSAHLSWSSSPLVQAGVGVHGCQSTREADTKQTSHVSELQQP